LALRLECDGEPTFGTELRQCACERTYRLQTPPDPAVSSRRPRLRAVTGRVTERDLISGLPDIIESRDALFLGRPYPFQSMFRPGHGANQVVTFKNQRRAIVRRGGRGKLGFSSTLPQPLTRNFPQKLVWAFPPDFSATGGPDIWLTPIPKWPPRRSSHGGSPSGRLHGLPTK